MLKRSLLIMLVVGACASDLGHGRERWNLVALSGEPVLADATPSLQLRNGQAFGSTGCNGFVGVYTQANDRLRISNLEMTLLACGRPRRADIHAQEARYYGALAGTAEVSRTGD